MKTYRVWQMKPEYFAKLTLATFGIGVTNVSELSEEELKDPTNLAEYEVTYEVDREGDILENLNQLFFELNQDDRPTGQIAHSLSMGDLIEVENTYYRVAMMGFEEVLVA